VRARPAAAGRTFGTGRGIAVKLGGALLERVDHHAQRPVEHLPRQHLEHPALELEIDAEIDRDAGPVRPEFPVVAQIFERAVEIFDIDVIGPRLGHPAAERFAQPLEPDDQVRDHLRLAVRTHPHRADPWQELAIATDIGDQVEHLLRRIG